MNDMRECHNWEWTIPYHKSNYLLLEIAG